MKTKFKKVVILALLGMFLAQSSIQTMAVKGPTQIPIGSDWDVTPVRH